MTRFDFIEVDDDDDDDYYCNFCGKDADYRIDSKISDVIHICNRCLAVINQKAMLIDGNEEI